MEYGLPADGGAARRGKFVGLCADGCRNVGKRFAAECHGADEHADAVIDGGGWLLAPGVCGEASEIRDAVDRDSDFVGDLRASGLSHIGAVVDGLYLVEEPGDRADRN